MYHVFLIYLNRKLIKIYYRKMFWIKSNLNLLFIMSYILILSFELIHSNENEKDIYSEINSVRLKKMEGLDKLIKDNDLTFFVYYYKKSSENSKKGAPMLKNVADKLAYLAQVVMVDCDDIEPLDTPACVKDPEIADGFPKMEVYMPPEYKINPYTKKMNSHIRKVYDKQEVSENLLYNFITQNIPARSVKLTTDNFENFAANIDFNKVLLFTDKTKTPLLFRGISNLFYDTLIFGEVYKDQTALIRKFKVTKFPTLIVYQTHDEEIPLEEPKINIFNKEIKAENIVNFLQEFALKEPLNTRIAREGNNSTNNLKYKVTFKNLTAIDSLKYFHKFGERKFIVYLNDKNEIPEDIKKFNMNTNGFFHFVNIDCVNEPSTCNNIFKINNLPSLILIKNIDANSEIEKVELPLDYPSIESYIYRKYNGELKVASPQTLAALNNEAKVNKKVPFLYLHEGQIPLGFYLLATENKYTKYIDFIVFENPTKDMMKNFKITKLPQLVVLLNDASTDQARLLTYNEELVYSRLSYFVNHYFNTERSTKIDEKDQNEEKLDISLISSNESFKTNCLKSNKKLCILGFLDGRNNKDSIRQFESSIKILEKASEAARKQIKPTTFSWVNATCQTEISYNLNINIESLPNLIVYIPSKDVYSSLIGAFDEENIIAFIDRVMQGKAPLLKISKDQLVFKDIQCENIKEVTESDLDEDESFKQFIEEERKKREQFDKERQVDDNKKGKKKKKKKSDL